MQLIHSWSENTMTTADVRTARSSREAFQILRVGFIAAPILAGLDKFFGLLTDWSQYLWPPLADAVGLSPSSLMYSIGVVEIAAGVLVAWRPRLGAYVVAAWLGGIMMNLLLLGDFWDIALRDLGLALGALALARLASAGHSHPAGEI